MVTPLCRFYSLCLQIPINYKASSSSFPYDIDMAMAIYVRPKRATDPLDATAKARLWGRHDDATSSGSEHEALSSLVHAFFECGDSDSPVAADTAIHEPGSDGKSDSDGGDRPEMKAATAVAALVRAWSTDDDPFRLRLLSDVSEAAAAAADLKPHGGSACRRRVVMARLREMGYNAGVCKARWESAGKLVAGSYEYIDVVVASADGAEQRRYVVDLGFAAEFEVARAGESYKRVVAELPEVMVARPEEVKQVVRKVGKAARRSLKAEGLHVPPWRKGRYMMAKWLGPYRRTVNEAPASVRASEAGGGAAKCRAVGFGVTAGVAICHAGGETIRVAMCKSRAKMNHAYRLG
ncbi:hypothetical protein Cni_G20130 [Canna indica]|uniref:Uncharacterized protein n=1 Tax=Canna indica TaxID=4628 RepID=A0AAQ3QJ80_9LILI|nr:hypothetical protein Cni_G20130 [Canna indica]